jgi:HD-GYP domain-containing protein (c-di-GMP phosphodiesterase class II)
MSDQQTSPTDLRLAELMASLSLAIDLGLGQPMEWVLRFCLAGVRLAQILGLSEAEQSDVYYLAMLRHIGCSYTATSDAYYLGDETSVAEMLPMDPDDMGAMMRMIIRLVAPNDPLHKRVRYLARIMSSGAQYFSANHITHCEVGEHFIADLGFDQHIQQAFWQVFERWDGNGIPNGLAGEAILPTIRVLYVAHDAAAIFATHGLDSTIETVRERAGRLYDPLVADTFCRHAADICADLEAESIWEAVLASEPGEPLRVQHDQVDQALQALADFTDLKSPHTRGHSRAVAELVDAAALQYRLPEPDIVTVRHAALIHDMGRVAVSSAIWNKSGPLSESEWEKVRLHPYYTERIFARSSSLSSLGTLGALHHEVQDGSGYFRGLGGTMLSPAARLLTVANAYCALIEERPHRKRHTPDEAADRLRKDGHQGRFDPGTVDAVLSAAGHQVRRPRSTFARGLSNREVEVLKLIARGLTNKQIGKQLSITEKTVEHHVTHIYNKIDVSNRASATFFAMQNHLLTEQLA